MYKPIRKARQSDDPIQLEELYFPEANKSERVYAEFSQQWSEELARSKSSGKAPSLLKALWKTYGWQYMMAGLCKAMWSFFVIFGAFYFIRSLLSFVNVKYKGRYNGQLGDNTAGWILSGLFFLDAYLLGLSLQRMGFICMTTGIKVRSALINAICRKAFIMAQVKKETVADIVAFVATDAQKVYDGMQELHYLWTAPFEALAILALLASLTFEFATPGVGVLCIVLPLQYYFGFLIAKYKKQNSANTNERGSMMQEILPAMKLVKYYVWETFFEKKIHEVRAREMSLATKNAIIKTINVAMVFAVPPMTAVTIFSAYEYGFGKLMPTVAFTTLSLFNILRFPLVVLPKALRAGSEGFTSINRIEEFLLMPIETKEKQSRAPGIHIERAQFVYDSGSFTLNVPEFTVKPGEVVAVVGRVGCGKSTLINAILGNLQMRSGTSQVGGRLAYVPQTAWIQNLAIRDNILFGYPMNEAKYADVIHACALELDMQILAAGDQTKGGLRGINLSGGQRQRVNLARAAYSDADVMLLDNALSAVDHHTAEHIFDHGIKEMFAEKATVLVTHQINFVSRCDKVAIMDAGQVVYFGPWNAQAQQMLSKYLPASSILHASGQQEGARPDVKAIKAKRAASAGALKATSILQSKGVLEAKASLGRATALFLWECGAFLGFWCVMFFLSAQTSRQMSDYWVRQWTADTQGWYTLDSKGKEITGKDASAKYVGFYAAIIAAFIVLMLFRGTVFFWWSLGGANRLYKKALHRVLFTPMGFFLVKPVGDLLVTFTLDQDMLDENLPDAMHYAGIYGLILLSTCITVTASGIYDFWYFLLGLIVFTSIMVYFYMPAATKLKVVKSDQNSLLVGMVAEVLEGLPVIQAYNKEEYFCNQAGVNADNAHTALFNQESLNLWLAFFCDAFGAILVLGVCVFAVTQRKYKDAKGNWTGGSLLPATVGLAFSNTIQMLVFYTWSVRLLTEVISLFASVEKITWLANYTPQDGQDVNNDGTVMKHDESKIRALQAVTVDPDAHSWPTRGVVQFDGVFMKYKPNAPWALKNVTFTINSHEKVGVVGRTGSGKSTLLLTLFRMFEIGKGRIIIDGVDIKTLSMARLRKGLSIIPQEPVLFSGTVRTNLDPFNESTDAELWDIMEKVGLAQQTRTSGGLDGELDGTGGGSWSLGQMQLVCLARAALRKVPVLCLDEATAAMDPLTEQLVMERIEQLFTDRTTITIAHRLDTVIQSDKVIVMEQGVLEEYDYTAKLLDDRDTFFSKLVDKSGPEAAAALRQLAAEHFAKAGTHTFTDQYVAQGRGSFDLSR